MSAVSVAVSIILSSTRASLLVCSTGMLATLESRRPVLLLSGEPLEACNHTPAGSSDVASSCLVDYVGDAILVMDRGTDLESYQLDLDAGSATWNVSGLGKCYLTSFSLSFLTCKTGMIIHPKAAEMK